MSNYKLKISQAFGDVSEWTYTGKCDANGGHCECGKEIVYRHFVHHPEKGEKVVGSTCIDLFAANSVLFAQMKAADKTLKKITEEKLKTELLEKYFKLYNSDPRFKKISLLNPYVSIYKSSLASIKDYVHRFEWFDTEEKILKELNKNNA